MLLLLSTLQTIQPRHLQLLNDIGRDLRNDLGRQIRRSLCITERRVDRIVDPPRMRMRLWLLLLLLLVPRGTIATVVRLWILARRGRGGRGHGHRGHHLRLLRLLRLWHVVLIGPIRRIWWCMCLAVRTRVIVLHPVYMVRVVVWAAVFRIVIVWHEVFAVSQVYSVKQLVFLPGLKSILQYKVG